MSDLSTTPVTQTSNNSSSVLFPSGPGLRKERGAIAAQACDTCRSRKQRCDEQRPKCGTCQKFKLECNYREPQPTKKDKTLVEILDRIKNLEGKIDSLSQRGLLSPSTSVGPPLQTSAIPPAAPLAPAPDLGPSIPASAFQFPTTSSTASGEEGHYQYVSSVYQVLKWPAIQRLLASIQPKLHRVDLSALERDGPASMMAPYRSLNQEALPTDTSASVARGPGLSIHNAVPGQVPMPTLDLSWDTVQRLSKAYFDSINLFFPILSRESFMSETLPAVFNHGFSESMSATIAYLVFALGEAALAGADGIPVHIYNGHASGVRGGTKERPPGLDYFNEARRRMGFHLSECSLENVQMFALASAYYGTCFHYMGLWRMTTSASLACQALVTSNPNSLSSPQADLIRRAFWHCSIMETALNLELCVPLTGLERMGSVVGLPDFSGPFCEEDYISNQESHFQEHFASQIVLRRLLVDFHGTLSQNTGGTSSLAPASTPFTPSTTSPGLSQVTIQQLALQLEQWRGMLPAYLRWQEDSPGAFPNSTTDLYNTSLYTPATTPITPPMPTATTSQPAAPSATAPLMFTTDLDAIPPRYSYALDVQVALLRSRYYYTKYLIHRPFLYKALHYPDAMVHEDAVGVAECLKSMLKWPVAMSPTCRHKRLVPCLFFFTQNFFGILVLLHLTTTVPILRRIRSTLCGERFELDAGETVGLYLDWLRDLKAIDPGAAWHWEVVKAIYELDE